MWSGYDSVQMFRTSIPDRRLFPRTPLMVQTFGIDFGESVRNIGETCDCQTGGNPKEKPRHKENKPRTFLH